MSPSGKFGVFEVLYSKWGMIGFGLFALLVFVFVLGQVFFSGQDSSDDS